MIAIVEKKVIHVSILRRSVAVIGLLSVIGGLGVIPGAYELAYAAEKQYGNSYYFSYDTGNALPGMTVKLKPHFMSDDPKVPFLANTKFELSGNVQRNNQPAPSLRTAVKVDKSTGNVAFTVPKDAHDGDTFLFTIQGTYLDGSTTQAQVRIVARRIPISYPVARVQAGKSVTVIPGASGPNGQQMPIPPNLRYEITPSLLYPALNFVKVDAGSGILTISPNAQVTPKEYKGVVTVSYEGGFSQIPFSFTVTPAPAPEKPAPGPVKTVADRVDPGVGS
ncbi:MAG: YPDG domain-containing protein, partial [Actinomycetaceae bacterium]|nr:YPDG domain-containing protein [Actinomycetaceae bacterium]